MAFDNLNPSYRWQQTGELPGYGGSPSTPVFGYRGWSDNYLLGQKQLDFQKEQAQKKWDAYRGILGNNSGLFDFTRNPAFGIPKPNYVGTGGVYNQGQIDAQSNLQRANLQQQAASNSQNFASTLASRGFSPMGSPLSDFYQQSALMRANAGAAQNETQLNFNAAQANRDAQIKAQGVNAGLYGSYTDALSKLADIQMRGQLQAQGQRFDLLRSLVG